MQPPVGGSQGFAEEPGQEQAEPQARKGGSEPPLEPQSCNQGGRDILEQDLLSSLQS